MKKSLIKILIPILILIIISAILLFVFKKPDSKQNNSTQSNPQTATSEEQKADNILPEVIKEPASPLGLYTEENKTFFKQETARYKWPVSDSDELWNTDTWTVPGQSHLIYDLACFSLVPTAENEIAIKKYNTDWLDIWNRYYGEKDKIGYEFSVFLKSGETKHITVKQTSDTMKLSEYFELYLYDDVYHADDKFYSHTTQQEFENRENVLNTSVKITLCNKCYDIEKIEITGFVYSSDTDFDQNGAYIGANKTVCTILPF